MIRVADSKYFQRDDLFALKAHAAKNEVAVDNIYFVTRSAKDFGKHLLSWGENMLGERLFEETYEEGQYPYEKVIGVNIVYSDDVPDNELFLMCGVPGGDRQCIGHIVTRS